MQAAVLFTSFFVLLLLTVPIGYSIGIATIIALAHNHPSGNIHPSGHDDLITRQVKSACDAMRLHFADHIIVTDGAYYSYHESGKL